MNARAEAKISKLHDILSMWSKDVIVDKTMPQESMSQIASLHAKYLRILADNRIESKKLQIEYEEMKKIRSLYYMGHLSEEELKRRGWTQHLSAAPKTLGQKQELLESDEHLTEILEVKNVSDEIVSVCETIMQHINYSMTTQLKEFMQWERSIRNG